MSKLVTADLVLEIYMFHPDLSAEMVQYRSADVNAVRSGDTMVVADIDDEGYSTWCGYRLEDGDWFLVTDLVADFIGDQTDLEVVAGTAVEWMLS